MRDFKIENGKCYIDGVEINRPLTQEDYDEIWKLGKEMEERRKAEWEALTEEEKKRIEEELSDPFYERISDDPFGH